MRAACGLPCKVSVVRGRHPCFLQLTLSSCLVPNWSFNFAESPYGEIDILEGNGWTRQSANTVSLHMCGTCSFPNLQGPELRRDCDLHAGANCEGAITRECHASFLVCLCLS